MPNDPKTLDWPQPDDRDAADPDAVPIAVLNLGDELAVLLEDLPDSPRLEFVDLLGRAWDASSSVPDSLRHVISLVARLEDAELEQFARAGIAAPTRFREMFAIMGHSRLLGEWLAKGVWKDFLEGEPGEVALTSDGLLRRMLSATTPEGGSFAMLDRDQFVARFQFAHAAAMTAIAASDLLRDAPFEATVARISALADVSCEVCLRYAMAQVELRSGVPVDDEGARIGVSVLALGKLGGRELNYSSDIDLMFVTSGDGKTEGSSRSIDATTWATRAVELMIRCLSEPGPLGPAYRVDTRLRPDGKAGALVRTLESAVAYYHQRGETWERQALLKLRPVAGDRALGWRFARATDGFVHRRYLSVRAINEIKALKHRIELRTEHRDETYRDVKTGFGGIRDIEFVVQFLQLVNGGRTPSVRSGTTLTALRLLAEEGCLHASEAEELARSYRLLRQIEHGLQIEAGEQTHRIPDHPAKLAALAARLGYRDGTQSAAKQMYLDLARATSRTRSMLLRLFTGLFQTETQAPSVADLALDPDIDPANAGPLLDPYGFLDGPGVCSLIQHMAKEPPTFRRFEARTRTYLASALPSILGFASRANSPMQALVNLDRLVSCLGAKGVFYELLAVRPEVLTEVGRLCTQGGWLLDMVERRPSLVDPWLDGIRTGASFDPKELETTLALRLATLSPAEAVSWTRDEAVLGIASADLAGVTTPRDAWASVTALAETILRGIVRHLIEAEAKRAGIPHQAAEGLCVLALGKLGGGSLDYGSDLDLVFISDGDPEVRNVHERVAQATVRLLQSESNTWQVDLRLRPQGSKGEVVSTLGAFRHYLDTELAFWERLALTRARVVIDPESQFGLEVTRIVRRACYGSPLPSDAAAQTLSMRERQQKEAPSANLKRGPGGIADSDFALSLAQLLSGSEGAQTPDVFRAYDAVIQGAADVSCAAEVAEHFRTLRTSMVRQRFWAQRQKLRFGNTPANLPSPPGGPSASGASGRAGATSARVSAAGPEWEGEVEELLAIRERAHEAFVGVMEWATGRL